MNELTDTELLERFARSGSEDAFTALVNRHIHLVHSAALRAVPCADQAEEVTQAVFIVLAHKAASLDSHTILSGWLYRTARLTAANFRRTELRRTQREQEAFMRSTLEEPETAGTWRELAPLLDDAMTRLGKSDHDALVLRYFENKSLQEVGKSLGVGERAAQKRVGRALERLRRVFHRRGVVATAAVIAGAISTHSVQAAPAGLAQTISAAAAGGSAVAVSTMTLAKGTISTMSWIKAKMAVALGAAALGVVALAGTAAIHHHLKRAESQQRLAEIAEDRARSTSGSAGYGTGSSSGGAGSMAVVAADNEEREMQAKHRAEAAGGPANVSQGPENRKLLDEQEARAKRRSPERQ